MGPSDEETSLTPPNDTVLNDTVLNDTVLNDTPLTETGRSERSELARVTAAAGWHRRVDERVDVYVRGNTRIRVIWQGDDAISGGTRYQDDQLETYSRDFTTVKGWLAR